MPDSSRIDFSRLTLDEQLDLFPKQAQSIFDNMSWPQRFAEAPLHAEAEWDTLPWQERFTGDPARAMVEFHDMTWEQRFAIDPELAQAEWDTLPEEDKVLIDPALAQDEYDEMTNEDKAILYTVIKAKLAAMVIKGVQPGDARSEKEMNFMQRFLDRVFSETPFDERWKLDPERAEREWEQMSPEEKLEHNPDRRLITKEELQEIADRQPGGPDLPEIPQYRAEMDRLREEQLQKEAEERLRNPEIEAPTAVPHWR